LKPIGLFAHLMLNVQENAPLGLANRLAFVSARVNWIALKLTRLYAQ